MRSKVTNTLLALTTCATLVACDDEIYPEGFTQSDAIVIGGGSTPSQTVTEDDSTDTTTTTTPTPTPTPTVVVEPNACVFDDIQTSGSSISGTLSDRYNGQYQFVLQANASKGTVSLDATTGSFSYQPYSAMANARGFSDRFSYALQNDGVDVAKGEMQIIYGAKRIMPLGDSITYGVTGSTDGKDTPSAESDMAIGYRKALYEQLTSAGYAVDFVGSENDGSAAGIADADHQGIPGISADNLANNIDAWLNITPADVVLMHAGTNDLAGQLQSPADAATDVHQLVETMHTWHLNKGQTLRVLASTIVRPNESPFPNSTLENTTALNTELLAQLNNSSSSYQSGFSVQVVDQFNALSALSDINTASTGDSVGLHPSTTGYSKMANTWFNALVASGELHRCN